MNDDISPAIAERLALGPDDGQGMRLVVSGGTGRGDGHARRWCAAHVPECGEPLAAEWAGRTAGGDPLYLVTYRLHDLAGPIAEIEQVLDEHGRAVVSGTAQMAAAQRMVDAGRARWAACGGGAEHEPGSHGLLERAETRTEAP